MANRLERMLRIGEERFQQQIAESGGAMFIEEVAALLGTCADKIEEMTVSKEILSFQRGGHWLFPKKQFVGNRVVVGLDVVYQALDQSLSQDAAVAFFLTIAGGQLSPLAHLLSGTSPEIVATIAKGHLVQGFD